MFERPVASVTVSVIDHVPATFGVNVFVGLEPPTCVTTGTAPGLVMVYRKFVGRPVDGVPSRLTVEFTAAGFGYAANNAVGPCPPPTVMIWVVDDDRPWLFVTVRMTAYG